MSDYIKATLWKGNDLKGNWEVTLKIDGVRAFVKDGIAVSRAGKLLHGLSALEDGDYEIYCGDWEKTITAVRTVDADDIFPEEAYELGEFYDERLFVADTLDPGAEYIKEEMEVAIGNGYEGLVLRQGDRWLKVKPKETYDVEVLGYYDGKGRNLGRLGGYYTEKGKVGTGLTDNHRENPVEVGTIIEVDCMTLTANGKFRHPRYVRTRYDKTS